MIAVRICFACIQASGYLRGITVTSGIFCAFRCETYIEGFRRRCYHTDTALIRCYGIAAAPVECSACCCFIETAVRIVRHHRIGMFAAYTVGFDLRLKQCLVVMGAECSRFISLPQCALAAAITAGTDLQCNRFCNKRYIVSSCSGSAAECLTGIILTDLNPSVSWMVFYGERCRNDTCTQSGRKFFTVSNTACLCAVFCGKAGGMKYSRMIAVILCDKCESLVLCNADTAVALCIQTVGSISSVRPPACLSSAFFSTSGSSLPRTEALRSIPRHAFGLK